MEKTLEQMYPAYSRLFEAYLKVFPDQTQVSIAMIQGDRVSYYGVIKKDHRLVGIDNFDHVFEAGSITKVL